MIAQSAVHTTGLNWESLAVIFGGFATVAGIMLAWTEHRQRAMKDQIADAVNHLSDVLQAKLETKDAVNAINIRLARLEGSRGIAVPNHDDP